MKRIIAPYLLLLLISLLSCVRPTPVKPIVPAVEYSQRIKKEGVPVVSAQAAEEGKARIHLVNEDKEVTTSQDTAQDDPKFYAYRGEKGYTRDYNGPLSLGDPGVSSSLWQESRAGNELIRDHRAWQPMDLITIVVTENAEGEKEAETETKSSSTISAAIENLLGLEDRTTEKNKDINLDTLISASTSNDFKGEGQTKRKGTLKAKISAMVVEVLASGIIRIEGQKIISVNSEEQTMVISGLVRPRDVSSGNEVDSAKIANMRIDFFGSGIVQEPNYGGWLGRIIRRVWPF